MITSDPLTFITISPIALGLALLIIPNIAPPSMADYIRRISRPLSMSLALAIFAITSMLFFGQIGDIDWLNF